MNKGWGATTLSKEQKDVFDLMSQGKSVHYIAGKLGVTTKAVKSRIERIRKKMLPRVDLGMTVETLTAIPRFTTGTLPNDPEMDDPEILYLRESLRHHKSLVRKYKKEWALEKEILNLFETTLKKYPNHKNFPILKKSANKSAEELVVMISDIHAGEIIKKKGVLGINEYNMEIMEQRLLNIFNNVNSVIQDPGCSFKKLHVFLLGDMVSGIIHSELKEGIAVIDQVYVTANIIAEMIYKWSKMFPQVDVSCVVGNHGRPEKEIKFKNKHDNYDGHMYHAIKIHLKNVANVEVEIPECPWMIKEIEGKKFLLTHGDSRVPGYNGISWYKVDKMDNNVSRTLAGLVDIKLDYICVAHFHDWAILPRLGGGNTFVNGSVIGSSDFGLFAIYKGANPIQMMFRVHHKHAVNHIDKVRVLN